MNATTTSQAPLTISLEATRQIFGPVSSLPEPLRATATEVEEFTRQLVRPAHFEWNQFHEAINRCPGTDLTFDHFKNTKVHETQGASGPASIHKAQGALQWYPPRRNGESQSSRGLMQYDPNNLTSAELSRQKILISTALSGVGVSLGDGHDDSAAPHMFLGFARPEAGNSEYFHALVATVTVNEEFEEVVSWSRTPPFRHNTTKMSYSADIRMMRLCVKNGFKNPCQANLQSEKLSMLDAPSSPQRPTIAPASLD